MLEYDLSRFYIAHNRDYKRALSELKNGHKVSHWMWYIFPQIKGLGSSDYAVRYGITSLEEATAYLNDELLGEHLRELCSTLLELPTNDAVEIFGNIDAIKLKSSMTLFVEATEDNSLFHSVLLKFYDGELDATTIKLLYKQ